MILEANVDLGNPHRNKNNRGNAVTFMNKKLLAHTFISLMKEPAHLLLLKIFFHPAWTVQPARFRNLSFLLVYSVLLACCLVL